MRRLFEGGVTNAKTLAAGGDYLRAATIRGRRLIDEIRYFNSLESDRGMNRCHDYAAFQRHFNKVHIFLRHFFFLCTLAQHQLTSFTGKDMFTLPLSLTLVSVCQYISGTHL